MPRNILLNGSETEGLVKSFLSSELALWLLIAACVGLVFYLIYKSVLYATFLLRLALGTIIITGIALGGIHMWLSTSAPVYLVIPGDPSGPLLLHGLDEARLMWTRMSDDNEDDEIEEEGDTPQVEAPAKQRSLCGPQGNCPPPQPPPTEPPSPPFFPKFDPYQEALKHKAATEPKESPSSTSSPPIIPTTPKNEEHKPAAENKPPRKKKPKPPPAPALPAKTSWLSKFPRIRRFMTDGMKKFLDKYWFG